VKAPVAEPEPSSEEEECPDLVPAEDELDDNSEEGEFEYDEEGLAKHFLEMEAEEGEAEMDEYGEEEPDNEFIVPDDQVSESGTDFDEKLVDDMEDVDEDDEEAPELEEV